MPGVNTQPVMAAAAAAAGSGVAPAGAGAAAPDDLAQQQLVKQRKPYTLQKAREKWTEDEHARFVEGLRLHGRQWRKIEGARACVVAWDVNAHTP
jgi:SHAQKYF class myb-like DNA-binding protein